MRENQLIPLQTRKSECKKVVSPRTIYEGGGYIRNREGQVILKVYEMVTGAYMSMYNRRLTLIFLLLGIDKLDACQVLESM